MATNDEPCVSEYEWVCPCEWVSGMAFLSLIYMVDRLRLWWCDVTRMINALDSGQAVCVCVCVYRTISLITVNSVVKCVWLKDYQKWKKIIIEGVVVKRICCICVTKKNMGKRESAIVQYFRVLEYIQHYDDDDEDAIIQTNLLILDLLKKKDLLSLLWLCVLMNLSLLLLLLFGLLKKIDLQIQNIWFNGHHHHHQLSSKASAAK